MVCPVRGFNGVTFVSFRFVFFQLLLTLVLGECKFLIASYLQCLKSAKGVNDERCRKMAKGYLSCRMDKYVFCLKKKENKNIQLVFPSLRLGGLVADLYTLSRNLMAPDEFKNLGLEFKDDEKGQQQQGQAKASSSQADQAK